MSGSGTHTTQDWLEPAKPCAYDWLPVWPLCMSNLSQLIHRVPVYSIPSLIDSSKHIAILFPPVSRPLLNRQRRLRWSARHETAHHELQTRIDPLISYNIAHGGAMIYCRLLVATPKPPRRLLHQLQYCARITAATRPPATRPAAQARTNGYGEHHAINGFSPHKTSSDAGRASSCLSG